MDTTPPKAVQAAAAEAKAPRSDTPHYWAFISYSHQVVYDSRHKFSLTTRILWHPWSVVALRHALHIAEQDNLAVEIRRALKRSEGHLLVTLGPKMMEDVLGPRALPFVRGEACYALSIGSSTPKRAR